MASSFSTVMAAKLGPTVLFIIKIFYDMEPNTQIYGLKKHIPKFYNFVHNYK